MVKKNQVKKYNVSKIMELVSNETDGQALKVYAQCIQDKNSILLAKRTDLLKEIQFVRKQSQKLIVQLNTGVKDRLQKKEKLIMDKKSRPTNEQMKDLADLFNYMENQGNIIMKNHKCIDQFLNGAKKIRSSLEKKDKRKDNGDLLDRQFDQLNKQCAKQLIVKQQLERERLQKQQHYATIHSTIEQYRKKYQIIEHQIQQKEKELDHLSSYFKNRQQEDNAIVHFDEFLDKSTQINNNRPLERIIESPKYSQLPLNQKRVAVYHSNRISSQPMTRC